MERWLGKIALVTGASSGIGAGIAEELAKAGVRVVGLARRVELVQELKEKLGKIKGEIIPLKGDISTDEGIEAVFTFIKEKFGAIHILVNNAGIIRFGSVRDMKTEYIKEIMNVNFTSWVICTQKTLRLMKEAKVDDGHIININSIDGHYIMNVGAPVFNVAPCSKYAVTALTEVLRQELTFLKTKIRVTSISPGFVETNMGQATEAATGETLDESLEKEMANTPYLKPKDVADAAIYVLSTPPHVQIQELTIRPVGEKY